MIAEPKYLTCRKKRFREQLHKVLLRRKTHIGIQIVQRLPVADSVGNEEADATESENVEHYDVDF